MEWDDVNKLLRHHGFKPVHFADPVENKNLPGERMTFSTKVKSAYSLKEKAISQSLGKKTHFNYWFRREANIHTYNITNACCEMYFRSGSAGQKVCR